MRKLNALVIYVFHALVFMTRNKTKNNDMSEVSITLKFR